MLNIFRHSSSPNVARDSVSLRMPPTLEVEKQLREELRARLNTADWDGVARLLRNLEERQSSLGYQAVASIVNSVADDGAPTPLHLVVGRARSREMALSLLRLGADPDVVAHTATLRSGVPVHDRPTPLFWAIANDDIGVAKALLAAGADPNKQNSLGETALMFLLRAQPSWAGWRSFRKVLLKAGAKPLMADYQGVSPFAQLLIDGRWSDAVSLVPSGGRVHRLTDDVKEKVSQSIVHRALAALVRVESAEVEVKALLDDMKALAPVLGYGLLGDILNRPLRNGPSLFVRMIQAELSIGALQRAVEIGASFLTSHRYPIVDGDPADAAPFHAAVMSAKPSLVAFALRHTGGWEINKPVGVEQYGPLHLLYFLKSPANLECARLLLESGADPYALTAKGFSLFDMAVAYRDVAGMELWAEYLVNPFAKASPFVRQIGINDSWAREEKAKLLEFGKIRASLPRDVESEMFDYAGDEKDPHFAPRAREYVEAFMVATKPATWDRDTAQLYKLLPRIMLAKNPTSIVKMVRAIDHLYDVDQSVRGFHPFEAELMILLAHPGPGDREAKRELGKALILALTSINRYTNLHITTIPAPVRQLWARLGVLSFSFRRWKWDTHGIKIGSNRVLSLFEQYGFTSMASEDGRELAFGPGYVLSDERKKVIEGSANGRKTGGFFNSQVRIEFRRGMLLASHRDLGTLVVRNSSPVFGRDLLKHPAYYSRFAEGNGLPVHDVKSLTPRAVEEGFQRVLDAHLYSPPHPLAPEIELLAAHLEEVIRDYESWKFSSEREAAWGSIEGIGSFMTGGYFSEGYGRLVQYLKQAVASARAQGVVAPELAFFKRGFPAWSSARFTDDDGKQYSTLALTPRTMQLLEKMIDSSATKREYSDDRGKTYQFFQKGFEMEGALIIVDGKGEGDEYNV